MQKLKTRLALKTFNLIENNKYLIKLAVEIIEKYK